MNALIQIHVSVHNSAVFVTGMGRKENPLRIFFNLEDLEDQSIFFGLIKDFLEYPPLGIFVIMMSTCFSGFFMPLPALYFLLPPK